MQAESIPQPFQINCAVLYAVGLVMAVGLLVGLVRRIGLSEVQGYRIDILAGIDREQDSRVDLLAALWPESNSEIFVWRSLASWREFFGWKGSGFWIGNFERLFFFLSLWTGASLLVPAWFVLKTAVYWQASNFTKFPERFPRTIDDAIYFVGIYRLGKYHATVALAGTAANLVIAFIGLGFASWLNSPTSNDFSCLCPFG